MKKKQYVNPRIRVKTNIFRCSILTYSDVGNQTEYGTGAAKRGTTYDYDFEEDM